jgi:hypothetical protein
VLAAMGVFHWWWLCNSGGCNRVVCSESGADLQGQYKVACVQGLLGYLPGGYPLLECPGVTLCSWP